MKKLASYIKEGLKINKNWKHKYKHSYNPDDLTEDNTVIIYNNSNYKSALIKDIDKFNDKISKLDNKSDCFVCTFEKPITFNPEKFDYANSLDYLIDNILIDSYNYTIILDQGHLIISYTTYKNKHTSNIVYCYMIADFAIKDIKENMPIDELKNVLSTDGTVMPIKINDFK